MTLSRSTCGGPFDKIGVAVYFNIPPRHWVDAGAVEAVGPCLYLFAAVYYYGQIFAIVFVMGVQEKCGCMI